MQALKTLEQGTNTDFRKLIHCQKQIEIESPNSNLLSILPNETHFIYFNKKKSGSAIEIVNCNTLETEKRIAC